MDEQNQATLEQQVAELKAALAQQGNSLLDQQQAMQRQEAQLKKIKGELIAQDHRFITVWSTLIDSIRYPNEREYFGNALKAVLFLFVPGTKSTIVLGASVVGLLTLVLMFQSNQLTMQQNQYFQKQIFIQAESDRRDQMVNIMEKLYEPTEASLAEWEKFDALSAKEQEAKEKKGEQRPRLEPKYNAQTRTASVLSYLNIQHQPLEKPTKSELPALHKMGRDLWAAVLDSSAPEADQPEVKDQTEVKDQPCEGVKEEDMESVDLHGALLLEAYLPRTCLGKANLQWANLEGANLEGANLQWAILEWAILKWANLEGAKNLTCEQLTSALGWQQAKTELKCSAPAANVGAGGAGVPASP